MKTASYNYNLAQSFYKVVENNSEKTALRYPNGISISYKELNELSNRLARFLIGKGIGKKSVVAIFNEKSVNAYALILACLKVGAMYTNLDVTSPWIRLEKILNTCSPSMVCFDTVDFELANSIKNINNEILSFNLNSEDFISILNKLDYGNVDNVTTITGSQPAYIMFTSGSTGFPKGAVMSHQNLLNFIQWGKQTFDVTSDDVFTNANPIYFDNSVFDFYVSIFNGATLVPLSHDLVKQPKILVEAINNSGCTIWFSVPSLLVYLLTTKSLTSDDFKTITKISFGGEGFPKNKLKQLYMMLGNRVQLFNVYGPTECTCICSAHIITDADFENMNELAPLGFMSPNFGYEILPLDNANPNLGELCLTGPCIGLGYYNDIDRTSKAFVQNPNVGYLQNMYKTGDIVEKAENGYLHFKGRVDNQIKHMGYRIELEEIEAAFSTLSYVDEVGVIYQKLSVELGQIVAYISINNLEKDIAMILNDVKQIVPPYMVPRTIKILPVLPKNQNGKIDRKQLKEFS
jgi:D-alanine--poly(phosphoribitol) ligase subunit 1